MLLNLSFHSLVHSLYVYLTLMKSPTLEYLAVNQMEKQTSSCLLGAIDIGTDRYVIKCQAVRGQ
jgi:hypothetical protein